VNATTDSLLPASTSLLAVQSLEEGKWRAAASLAPQLGRPGIPVRALALSMRERTFGVVTESWATLVRAAADCPGDHRLGPAGPGDPGRIAWPRQTRNEFWDRLGRVGQREEDQARRQWQRIEASPYPKRTALIEAGVDHLTWVFFDGLTWRAPSGGEWLPNDERVVRRGKLGETGREYFLRRANELYHSVYPLRGSLTRTVWDDLGQHRGLYGAALQALAARVAERTDGTVHRPALIRAIEEASYLVSS
jgi:hypothetical protein